MSNCRPNPFKLLSLSFLTEQLQHRSHRDRTQRSYRGGGHLAQQLRCHWGYLHLLSERLGSSPGSASASTSWRWVPRETIHDGPTAGVPPTLWVTEAPSFSQAQSWLLKAFEECTANEISLFLSLSLPHSLLVPFWFSKSTTTTKMFKNYWENGSGMVA